MKDPTDPTSVKDLKQLVDQLLAQCLAGRVPEWGFSVDVIEEAVRVAPEVSTILALYAFERGCCRNLLMRTDSSDAVRRAIWQNVAQEFADDGGALYQWAWGVHSLLAHDLWRPAAVPVLGRLIEELRDGARLATSTREHIPPARIAAALLIITDNMEELSVRVRLMQEAEAYCEFNILPTNRLPEIVLRAAFRHYLPDPALADFLLENECVLDDAAWCDELLPVLTIQQVGALPSQILDLLPAPRNVERARDILERHVWTCTPATRHFAAHIAWFPHLVDPLVTKTSIIRCLASAPEPADLRETLLRMLPKAPLG